MGVLSSVLTSAKVNEGELDRMRDIVGQLNALDIHPDPSAPAFVLLTSKLSENEVKRLKEEFALPGFAAQIEALEGKGKALTAEFTGKSAAAPSAAWKLLLAAEPEAVLWMAFRLQEPGSTGQIQALPDGMAAPRARSCLTSRCRRCELPPSFPATKTCSSSCFFAVMDKKLDTPEAIKSFLEPFSPPAAPPPPALRRRAVKRESKTTKSRFQEGS